jgi:glucose-1-phosphate adenylyltransferase
MDFEKMIKNHEESGAEISIATIPVTAKDASDFGILKADDNYMITSFIEKPKKELLPEWKSDVGDEMRSYGKEYLASMGIYLFNKKLLFELLENNTRTDFGKEIIPKGIRTCRAYAYVFRDYWRDIGTIGSFYQANLELTGPNPKFSFYSPQRGSIFTHPRFLPPTQLESAFIVRSLVTEGSVIKKAEIQDSVIGLRSIIQRGFSIKKSVVMGADFYELAEKNSSAVPIGIGEGSCIENAIIDKNARIWKKVTIKNSKKLKNFDSDNYCIRENIVIIPKNAVIADRTII